MNTIRRGPSKARTAATTISVVFHCPHSAASVVGVAGVVVGGHAGQVGHVGHPGQAGTDAGANQRDTKPVTQQTAILLTIESTDGIQRAFPFASNGPAKTVTAAG